MARALNRDILIYSNQNSDFVDGYRYANPRFFNGSLRSDVKKVVIVGEWPAVAEAYQAKGIPVRNVPFISCPADIEGTGTPKGSEIPPPNASTAPKKATEPDTVEIAETWQTLEWPDLRHLAAQFTDKPVTSKRFATETIEAELARRAQAAKPAAPAADKG